jgi:hypothetical protein
MFRLRYGTRDVTLDDEINYHLKQAYREFRLALRSESEGARRGHLNMAMHHFDVVKRLRIQLDSDEQPRPPETGEWL